MRGRPRNPPKLVNWVKDGPAPVPDWLQLEQKNDPVLATLKSGKMHLRVQLGIGHRTIADDEADDYLTLLLVPETLAQETSAQIQEALEKKRQEISQHSRNGGSTTRTGGLLEEVEAKAPDILRRFLTRQMSGRRAQNALESRMAPDPAPSARTLRSWRKKLAVKLR